MIKIGIVGTTGIDILPNPEGQNDKPFLTLLSGGAAFAALAIALMGNRDIDISTITTCSQKYDNPLLAATHKALDQYNIHTLSYENAKPPVNIFNSSQRDAGHTIERVKDKNADSLFTPGNIRGLKTFDPSVLMFIGSTMANPATYKPFVEYARQQREKGTVIIVDLNPRKPVSPEVVEAWAKVVDILKVSDRDIIYQVPGYDPKSPMDVFAASRRLLDSGPSIVATTFGMAGSKAYWINHEIAVGVKNPMHNIERTMSGDAFTAGLALAIAEDRATSAISGNHSRNIGNLLTTEKEKFVGRVVGRATDVASNFLQAVYDKGEDRTLAFRPLAFGTAEELVQQVYPGRTIILAQQ